MQVYDVSMTSNIFPSHKDKSADLSSNRDKNRVGKANFVVNAMNTNTHSIFPNVRLEHLTKLIFVA